MAGTTPKKRKTNGTEVVSFRTSETIIPEYLPCEMFLELTNFFTPSSKRLPSISSKQKTLRRKDANTGEFVENKLSILAVDAYGLPVTFDQDLYHAFLKICDKVVSKEGTLPEPIEVPTKKLLRYASKASSQKEIRETKGWFRVMKGTVIEGEVYHAKKKEFRTITTSVFAEVRMRGQYLENGEEARTNLVWLTPWFKENYEAGYTRNFDFSLYKRLRRPISKALVSILETGWFAASGGVYTKSYSALASDLLLTQHSYLSDIKRQLDPAHKELKREQFIGNWEYKKTNGDCLIVYSPGEKWFNDQKARLKRRKAHTGKSFSERVDRQGREILISSKQQKPQAADEIQKKIEGEMKKLAQQKRVGTNSGTDAVG